MRYHGLLLDNLVDRILKNRGIAVEISDAMSDISGIEPLMNAPPSESPPIWESNVFGEAPNEYGPPLGEVYPLPLPGYGADPFDQPFGGEYAPDPFMPPDDMAGF